MKREMGYGARFVEEEEEQKPRKMSLSANPYATLSVEVPFLRLPPCYAPTGTLSVRGLQGRFPERL